MVNHTSRRLWSLIAVLLVSVFLIGCTASTGSTGKSDGGNHASSSPGKNTGSSPKGGDDHTADPLPDPKIKLADDDWDEMLKMAGFPHGEGQRFFAKGHADLRPAIAGDRVPVAVGLGLVGDGNLERDRPLRRP